MGADPKKSITNAISKWDGCVRPEVDRIKNMCRDYHHVSEKKIKDSLAKDMQKAISGRISSCCKTLEKDVTSALSDFRELPDDIKKEMDKGIKFIKGYTKSKECLTFEASIKKTSLTVTAKFAGK